MTAMDWRMASLIALSRSSSEWLRVTSAAIFSTSTTAPSAFFTGKWVASSQTGVPSRRRRLNTPRWGVPLASSFQKRT